MFRDARLTVAGRSMFCRPSARWIQFRQVCVLVPLLAGCGLPTWSQITGAKPENTGPVEVVAPPVIQPPPPPTPPPPPPKPDPAKVIADFQELNSHEINDGRLLTLTQLEEGLEAIEELDLKNSRVTTAGFQHFGNLTHLARLDLRGTQLDQAAFPFIGAATAIEELRLDGNRVTVQAAEGLRPLSKLKILSANGINLTPIGWDDLILNHPELEELSISSSNANDLTMTAVAKLTNLRRLFINDTGVTDLGLAQLAPLEHLEHLNITGTQIFGTCFDPPGSSKPFQALTELLMGRTPLNEKGADAVRKLKELRRLDIGEMPTMQDPHFIRLIQPLDKLESLTFVRNVGLTGLALRAVAGHKTLQDINMSHCPKIDDAAFRFLSKCEELKRINIAATGCTIQGTVQLKQSLPEVEIVNN